MLLWFNEINPDDIEKVGGKGINLGKMANEGLRVPDGFCIITDAYKEHISRSNLWEKIEDILEDLDYNDVIGIEKKAKKIQELIAENPMSEKLKDEIKKAYNKLLVDGYSRVAIRSSATAEDLPDASFAGQQETFLSVKNEDDVLKYVKKCWTSLWTKRAISYRTRKGFDHKSVSLSVVIQGMIESEKSGVLFTVNPLNNNRDEMLINASYGLGESVVSGKVTPDTYRISRESDQLIVEKKLGDKETKIVSAEKGTIIEKEVSEKERKLFCLNTNELKQLRELGKKVEAYYKKPQDIEWAFFDDCLFLLQTRPITALNQKNNSDEDSFSLTEEEQLVLDGWKEHVPDAPYPLEHSILVRTAKVKNDIFGELGISLPLPEKAIQMKDNGTYKFNVLKKHLNPGILLSPYKIYNLLKLNPSNKFSKFEEKLALEKGKLQEVDVKILNDEQLINYIQSVVSLILKYVDTRFRVYVFPMVIRGKLLKVVLRLTGFSNEVNQFDLLAGLDQKTTLIEKDLYELATFANEYNSIKKILIDTEEKNRIKRLQEMENGTAFLDKLNKFIEKNGARTMKALLPFSNLSWSENKEGLLDAISAILRSDNIEEHKKKFIEGEQKYNNVKNKIEQKLPGIIRKSFQKTLKRFREDCKGRESLLYNIEECYVLARKGVFEVAKRLEERKYIEEIDDIKFLTITELYELFNKNNKDKILKKIKIRMSNRQETMMVWDGYSYGTIDENSDYIEGISGSPGIIKGKVKVISGISEFSKLDHGDILVCKFTDPAWTPLFFLASAVISDTGGPLSHAAIVAREYNIPAVLGTKVATSRLEDNDNVIVDGSKGIVSISK